MAATVSRPASATGELQVMLFCTCATSRLWLESQTGIPDLSGAGAQSADKTQGNGWCRAKPEEPLASSRQYQCWSWTLYADQLQRGRSVRLFNVIDDFNREALCASRWISPPASRVKRALEQVITWRGRSPPLSDVTIWARNHIKGRGSNDGRNREGITLGYIQPGNPQQNAYIERF